MSHNSIRVLLVEDNPGDVRLICEMLAEVDGAQMEVECVGVLSLALKRLTRGGIDVLLLDLSLPDGQGLDVCVSVHRKALYVPIVVLTELDDETMAAKTLQMGVQDYLVKGQVDSRLLYRSICYAIERKRAEEALKKSEQNFRNSLDSSPLGVRIVNAGGELLYANRAILDIYGYGSIEDLRNTPLKERYTPKSYAEFRERKRNRELGKPAPSNYEISITRKNGEVRHLAVFRKEVMWGGETQFQNLYQDITERRQAQEQLQHSQLLASLGQMTAGIAHEVNNPLSSILLYSQLLLTTNIPAQAKEDLKVIQDEAKRASRIITGLLTYSRRVEPRMRRFNLHKILKKVLDMRQYQEGVHNITVTTRLVNSPVYVKGDSDQLMQVFMNLVLNAEEAVKGCGRGNIVITTRTHGEQIKVSICDDGTGIPPENLAQIFSPFFTTKQPGEGTGLGLSICYGIVTSHGGMIQAKNNETGGATFTVELPLSGAGKR